MRHKLKRTHAYAVRYGYGQRQKHFKVVVAVARVSGTNSKPRGEYSAGACISRPPRDGRTKVMKHRCTSMPVYGRTPTAAVKKALASLARSLR